MRPRGLAPGSDGPRWLLTGPRRARVGSPWNYVMTLALLGAQVFSAESTTSKLRLIFGLIVLPQSSTTTPYVWMTMPTCLAIENALVPHGLPMTAKKPERFS